jgi:hypothetical protein
MTNYQVAIGSDNESAFADLNPQPSSIGVEWPIREVSANNTPKNKGARLLRLRYRGQLTSAQFDSLLTQFGVDTVEYCDITCNAPERVRSTWSNYNGRVFKPFNPDYEMGYYHDVVFEVRRLEDT